MSAEHVLFTAEEYFQIATEIEEPMELTRGVLFEMRRGGESHRTCCVTLSAVLGNWARPGQLGLIASNDCYLITERNPDTVRCPELYFVKTASLVDGQLPQGLFEIPPDLCVEVLSPDDRWSEVIEKIKEYFRLGVSEVWVLDPARHEAQIHLNTNGLPHTLRDGDTLTSERLPEFECAVSDLFEGC